LASRCSASRLSSLMGASGTGSGRSPRTIPATTSSICSSPSEGTLGAITRATMKLHPAAADHRTAFVSLTDVRRLAEFFSLALAHQPGALSAFELIPEIGVSRVVARYGVARPLTTMSEWYVLMRFSGPEGVGDALIELLSD